jgi:hypothetical protein
MQLVMAEMELLHLSRALALHMLAEAAEVGPEEPQAQVVQAAEVMALMTQLQLEQAAQI